MPASDDVIRIGLSVVTDAGTRKTLEELAGVRKQIDALTKEFKDGTKDLDTFTKEMSELEKQAKKLDEALDEVGEKRRVDIESGDLGDPDQAGAGSGLRKAGRELRNLPSVQIPGLGIGTDAIGNITRLTGTVIDLSEKSKIATVATNLLTPALGAQAAATVAAYAPMALLVAGLLAVGAAVKSVTDSIAERMEKLKSELDARRSAVELAGSGASTEEAQKKLDDYNATIATQQKLLDENKAKLGENADALKTASQNTGIMSAGLKAGFDTTDAAQYQAQVDASNAIIAKATVEQEALKAALEEGLFAANDAAEAEKKLAAERSKAALDQANAAGKELEARQRALAATGEQNEKRLQTIEDEKAVIQAQLDSLKSSGDTSEEVTAQIEKLNGQLGSLGKEADFISSTALEASRKRDAEKKAAKDAEESAKKAEAAQNKYTDAVRNAGRTFKQSSEDIRTKLGQGLADNLTGLLRDATDLTTKYRRDTLDLDLKAQRSERDALTNHLRDIEDIRESAQKSEQEAIREGDFKQLFLAREAAADALRREQRETQREGEDRRTQFQDERSDLLQNAERARADRLLAFDRQNADTRQNADRQLQDARLAQSRALALAKENQNLELAQLRAHYGQLTQIHQQFFQGVQQMAAGMRPGIRAPGAGVAQPQLAVAQLAQIFQT